ncbi:conserved Plasmodium protein, unknown function [Plasmodium gallinaceum]|uniref:Uncharacterized protein n=1 Tax=Plasmodium gallinaceum TaxID=5849 RepID=A0A1J1GM72_PLAGA|nr:conserved Plasmodium protein, unknown function [Plasmodium gallinaceum]CRG93427.1 conserved Plasmodium protein, unknown function [Plasmodium gallinaceum]
MEEKFLQTHITLLFYLILLFYLKNFTVNFIEIPKKILHYIKVYYSFLIILTAVGFFSRLIILIQIFIVQKINEILNKFLNSNSKNVKIKKNIRFNKDSSKLKLKKKKLSDIDNNFKYLKNNNLDKLNHDKFSKGNIDLNKKNYINHNQDANKYDKKREAYIPYIIKKRKKNKEKNIENDQIKNEDIKRKAKDKMKNDQDTETYLETKENTNFDYSYKQKYNFFTHFSNVSYNEENSVEKNNNMNCNKNNNVNSNTTEHLDNDLYNSKNKYTNNNIKNDIKTNSNNNIYNNPNNSFINYRDSNCSYTCVNEMNKKINDTFTKSEKIPLKSILKKNILSNDSLKIKNNQKVKSDKHIRFNADIETYFFEKNSFEEDAYNNDNDSKQKFYRIFDAYNLTNTNIFSYCNVSYNLNLVFNDVINSFFVYKDKLVKKF